jgi:hypothetical protein
MKELRISLEIGVATRRSEERQPGVASRKILGAASVWHTINSRSNAQGDCSSS